MMMLLCMEEVPFVMLYLAWDREINISLYFCDVFVWKGGPRPRTSSRCYHGNKSAATFKKGIFVHPPERLTTCKIWRGLKIFISQDVWFLQRLVLKGLIIVRVWPFSCVTKNSFNYFIFGKFNPNLRPFPVEKLMKNKPNLCNSFWWLRSKRRIS